LALLEALATGLPTVASDIGGCRAIVTDGHDGRLAPPNDGAAWVAALDALVTESGTAVKWSQAGRDTVVKKFSINHVAGQHLALFERIMRGHS
jgi:glycosyltransferase involved in cell wall biosynthesis